jgi:hypothetical protein
VPPGDRSAVAFVCVFVCVFVRLFVCVFVRLFACLFACLWPMSFCLQVGVMPFSGVPGALLPHPRWDSTDRCRTLFATQPCTPRVPHTASTTTVRRELRCVADGEPLIGSLRALGHDGLWLATGLGPHGE